jgi:hypothetical protein
LVFTNFFSRETDGTDSRNGWAAILFNLVWLLAATWILSWALQFFLPNIRSEWQIFICFLFAGAMAGMVAYGELLSRYQDSPTRLLTTSATAFYIFVNIAAAILAFGLIRALHVLEPAPPAKVDPHGTTWLYQLLLASFGAIAFFRTSLFTVRVGGSDIGIGPSAMLQTLLSAADRMIDRSQAENRASRATEILKDVDYRRARAPLPTFCIILMQNPTAADTEGLLKQIAALDQRVDIDDDSKMRILGIYLIRMVGDEVLQRSVEALGSLIGRSAAPADGLNKLLAGIDFAKARKLLADASFVALPNMTQEDLDSARRQVDSIAMRSDITDEMRVILLGAYLRSLLGIDKLKQIIAALGDKIIKQSQAPEQQPVQQQSPPEQPPPQQPPPGQNDPGD